MFDTTRDADLFELDENDFDTLLASDVLFTGNIRFSKPFIIKGSVSGKITATSDLVIDTGATVKADIEASRVLVRGKVNGNIKGERLIFVTSTGSVEGDVISAQLVLEPGSTFSGRCTMVK